MRSLRYYRHIDIMFLTRYDPNVLFQTNFDDLIYIKLALDLTHPRNYLQRLPTPIISFKISYL